jgi:hypothetical protein
LIISNFKVDLGFSDNKKWVLHDSLSNKTHFERALSILKSIDRDFELEAYQFNSTVLAMIVEFSLSQTHLVYVIE